jgi:hypothetical protein
MIFDGSDQGPCWLTEADRIRKKFDCDDPDGATEKYKFIKAELIQKLEAANLPTWGTKKDITARCNANSIETSEERPKIIEGWMGKPKGAFQVLFERGFIQVKDHQTVADAFKSYTMAGKKNDAGVVIVSTSIKEMISSLPGFVDEKTLLQFHAEGRSIDDSQQITLIRSPKCHPEVAGEGIEYDWAASKSWYRELPAVKKNTKEKFRANVRKSMSQITKEYRWSFSKRAREYILAYDTLARWREIHGDDATEPETSAYLLDKVVNKRRSHRSVSHDTGWLNQLVTALKNTNSQ